VILPISVGLPSRRNYRNLLTEHGMVRNLPTRDNRFENAAMVSSNRSPGVITIHGEQFSTRDSAMTHIFGCIEVNYNPQQPHYRSCTSRGRI
jgi:hypothetical protein